MNYLLMFVAGILGVFLHALVKIAQINKRYPVKDVTFAVVWKHYWRMDRISFIISITTIVSLVFVSTEIMSVDKIDMLVSKEHWVNKLILFLSLFVKTSFIVFGYFSDSLIYNLMGRVEKFISGVAAAGGFGAPEQKDEQP